MKVDDLILIKTLGKGNFGEVFLTQKKGCKEFYATKRLDRAYSEKQENIKRLQNEISILKKIKHPNIVSLIDLKKTKGHIYIVMEYCNGGGLSSCLKKYKEINHRPFSEEIVQYIMRQIVNAVNFLHFNKIIHRDLKLDNILVTFNSEKDRKTLNMMEAKIKIIDFGFSTTLKSSKSNLTYTVLGTPANMDPQILQNLHFGAINPTGYDDKADIWSLGTLCYEMLVGHMPFSGSSFPDLYQKVEQGKYSLPTNLSEEVVSFIDAMLQKDPNKRLNSQELLKHDFLIKNTKSFKPLDVRNFHGKIRPDGKIQISAGSNLPNKGGTIWDFVMQAFFHQNPIKQNGIHQHQTNSQNPYITPQMKKFREQINNPNPLSEFY